MGGITATPEIGAGIDRRGSGLDWRGNVKRVEAFAPPDDGYFCGASHSLQGRIAPSFSALPAGVTTHGRLDHGGLCRTCWA